MVEGRLASHGNSPEQPECCARTTFGSFLLDLFGNFIFYESPRAQVPSQTEWKSPGIPWSQSRAQPLGISLQGWEVTAPLALPRPTKQQPLEEPNLFPCLSHPLGEDLDNNKTTSQEFKSNSRTFKVCSTVPESL